MRPHGTREMVAERNFISPPDFYDRRAVFGQHLLAIPMEKENKEKQESVNS